jgi:hypothetical protein
MASGSPDRKRLRSRRTVRGGTPRSRAMVGPSWPSRKRLRMAWRTGTGTGRGMAILLGPRDMKKGPQCKPVPDRGPTSCRDSAAQVTVA